MAKKKKLTLGNLTIKRTPNPHRRPGDAKVGKKHNMPYTHFIHNLFELNESLPQAKKMTDAEIVRQIKLEYPGKDFKARFDSIMDQRKEISRLRSFYNNGSLVPSFGPPEKMNASFYYDIDGFACNPRYSIPRRLSVEEVSKFRDSVGKRHNKWREKKVTE